MARLLADGQAAQILEEECPRQSWRICDFRDRLSEDSDFLLWDPDGPVQRLGGFAAISDEAGQIVALTLRKQPGGFAVQSVKNTLNQLTRFSTGHGLEQYRRGEYPVDQLGMRLPHSVQAYEKGRQGQGTLERARIARFHTLVIPFALLGSAAMAAALALRGFPAPATFFVYLLGFLTANAAVAGSLSVPNNRYQSRVIWLLVFFALAAAMAFLNRPPGPSLPPDDDPKPS